MDEDRPEGVAKEVSGSLKEAIGMVTGDTETQAAGAAEKTAGAVETDADRAQDAVDNAANG